MAFVCFGLQRGELRKDMDVEMIVSILDWMMERFQDALLTAELDPGLFRRQGNWWRRRKPDSMVLAALERAILRPVLLRHEEPHRR